MEKYKVINISESVGKRIPVTISFEAIDGTEKTPIMDSLGKIIGYRAIHILKAGESVITEYPPPPLDYRFKTELVTDSEEVKKSSVKKKLKKEVN